MSSKQFVSEPRIRLVLLHRFSDIMVIPVSAMLTHGLIYKTWAMDSFLALSVAMSMASRTPRRCFRR